MSDGNGGSCVATIMSLIYAGLGTFMMFSLIRALLYNYTGLLDFHGANVASFIVALPLGALTAVYLLLSDRG